VRDPSGHECLPVEAATVGACDLATTRRCSLGAPSRHRQSRARSRRSRQARSCARIQILNGALPSSCSVFMVPARTMSSTFTAPAHVTLTVAPLGRGRSARTTARPDLDPDRHPSLHPLADAHRLALRRSFCSPPSGLGRSKRTPKVSSNPGVCGSSPVGGGERHQAVGVFVREVLDRRSPDEIREGDVLFTDDPWSGRSAPSCRSRRLDQQLIRD
jgi:hypothetical protein